MDRFGSWLRDTVRKLLWKIKVLQWCCMFYWLVEHEKSMTNTKRFKCGFTNNLTCAICGHKEKTILHVLWDCRTAWHIWNQVWDPGTCESFCDLTVVDWLRYGVGSASSLTVDCQPLKILFIVIWWIWKWRNAVIFQQVFDGLQLDMILCSLLHSLHCNMDVWSHRSLSFGK